MYHETVKFHGFLQVQRARGPNVLACAECWVPSSPVVIVLGKGITCDCTHLTALVVGNLHPAFSSCRGGNRRREVASAFAHARVVHIPCDDRASELVPGCWAVDHSGPGSRGTNRAEVARGHLSHATTHWVCRRVVFQNAVHGLQGDQPSKGYRRCSRFSFQNVSETKREVSLVHVGH